MATRYLRVANDGAGGRPGAVAAGARSGAFAVASFGDDVQNKHVTGIKSNLATLNVHVQLDIAGKVIADLDLSDLNTAEGYVPLDYVVPGGAQISLNIINDAGAPVAINTLALSLRYEASPT